jgi:hypothetical protein
VRRLWAIGILTAAFVGLQFASPASACGCGGLAVDDDATVSVLSERAIVSHSDGIEQIDLLLDLDSTSKDTGLVFPTPTPATVEAGDRDDFAAVERQIRPRPAYADDWWGFASDGVGAGGSGVEVVAQVTLGPLEATTLKASNASGLTKWLNKHKYKLSANTTKYLDYYVKKKWSFVAVKLDGASVLEGELDPLRITFETDELVYPMRLSAAASDPQALRLYVFGDSRVDVVQDSAARAPLNAARSTVWAGPVDDPALAKRGAFLTVVDLEWEQPRVQISTDIAIIESASRDTIIPTVQVIRPIGVLGIPVGVLVVGWAVIGLLLLFGALVARTRTR